MDVLTSIISANIVISLISLVGVVTLLKYFARTQQYIDVFVSFAAGVMISTAFINILHEALVLGDLDVVLTVTLGGIIVGFFMERGLLFYHHHHEDQHNLSPSAYLVLMGDAVHNFIDGIAIAAAFIVNPGIGITTTLAIAAHEIPQEFADFSVLVHSGMNKIKALIYNLATAFTAVLGGVVGYYSLQSFDGLTPVALAFSAGIFIYVAAADLIPELHQEKTADKILRQSIPFLVGILIIMMINNVYAHDHDTQRIDTQYQTEEVHQELFQQEVINQNQ